MQRRNALRCSCDIAWQDRYGQAYNEEAFRYFLALERTRSRRFGRPCILVLVHLAPEIDGRGRAGSAVAIQVLASLLRCFRQTDVVGWYRRHRVAAALLTDLGNGDGTSIPELVHRRVAHMLIQRLSAAAARRLQVRVYPQVLSRRGPAALTLREV
jgi:hypothetical protein